jgi:hypothetical protein
MVYEKVYVPREVTSSMDSSFLSGEVRDNEGADYVAVYYQVPVVGQMLDVEITSPTGSSVVRYMISDIEVAYNDSDYTATYKLRKLDSSAIGPDLVTAIQNNDEIKYFSRRS